ncbi:dTDP-L-rhamnose 4-epimerase [Ensifer psoraleae]|uniref:NAD-dependent epimerase/dehydratase family protein n=1 Tax=Sinorhizobium psoraleae TaxID=520838 RepID=UPI0015682D53|nr:NAD-dependent epimerase/dehydratase family protein [Sinorhizobium psoraleae]NRP73083.1 dTDP-L-rhamnose 4-epimerase [Sinorhizobium psoraleae]
MKILVTGGAGFVGSFLCENLHKSGHDIRIFDNYEPQVHSGSRGNLGALLQPNGLPMKGVEIIFGDTRNPAQLDAALKDVDAVVHLAAQVGVGQSMYEIHRYVDHNTVGTAVLLELLASRKHSVKKLVVASSMSIYGEGGARCSHCGDVTPTLREAEQMRRGDWEVRCPICDRTAAPIPTNEAKPVLPTSIYAISKRDQEEMCLVVGRAYDIPAVALRFFNIYGPRQSLGNPYTGVAAIFSSRLLNNNRPVVFEDGNQTRDFVHVKDIVQAISLALAKGEANGHVFNVGTGRPTSIKDVAIILARKMRRDIAPQIENKFREGDVRHCYADISKIQRCLGYKPTVELESGIEDLIAWAEEQKADDRFEHAAAELAKRGLAR